MADINSTSVRPRNVATTIGICFLVAMLEGFDIQAVGLVAANLAKMAGLGKDQLGFVFAMANVGLVFGAAVGGWLEDRIGRKPVFIFAVTMFGLFMLSTMFAASYASLLIVRVLTGFGLGAAMTNIMTIASEVARPERRASTATMMFCGFPFGGAASSVFVANLPAQYDWRAIFLVGGVIPLLVALLIVLLMPETRGEGAPTRKARVSVQDALFGEGRAGTTLLVWLTFFPTLMVLYVLLNWLPSFSVEKGFAKPIEFLFAGLKVGVNASFSFNLLSVAGALVLGQLSDRVGFRWPVIVAYAGLFLSLLLLAQAGDMLTFLAWAGVAGFFILGSQYALYGVAAAFYPPLVRGVGSGFAIAVGRIGAILGPILAGQLFTMHWTANQVILALAPLAAVAGVAVLSLSFRRQAAE